MNKKLISLAVAAAMTAPAAALAEATLYGKLNVSLDYADVSNVVLPTYGLLRGAPGQPPVYGKLTNGEDFEGWGMSGNGYIPGESRASRIGVKGSEDLGGGLKAIYQVEFGINLNDTNDNVVGNNDAITYRNTFIGLAGNFGTALFGRHDTPLKISTGKLDLFADTMADYNGTVGFRDLRADNVVAYLTPNWNGFQLAGAIVPAGGATAGAQETTFFTTDVTTDVVDFDGTVIGTTTVPIRVPVSTVNAQNLNSDSIAEHWSLAAIYSNGPFYASAAYEALGYEAFNNQSVSLDHADCNVPQYIGPPSPVTPYTTSCDYNGEDSTAWRFGLGLLDWNGFTLTGIYENRDQEPGSGIYGAYTDPRNPANSSYIPLTAQDAELWQIQAGYAFGNNMIKAMYGQSDYNSGVHIGENVVRASGGPTFAKNITDLTDYNVETWAIGFDHNFSKRTKVYALYTEVDSDQEDVVEGSNWSGFSLGMIHNF